MNPQEQAENVARLLRDVSILIDTEGFCQVSMSAEEMQSIAQSYLSLSERHLTLSTQLTECQVERDDWKKRLDLYVDIDCRLGVKDLRDQLTQLQSEYKGLKIAYDLAVTCSSHGADTDICTGCSNAYRHCDCKGDSQGAGEKTTNKGEIK